MRIKTSSSGLTLYRYTGLIEGKSREQKIAVVPAECDPENLPDAILDVLTRLEVRELKEYFLAERSRRAVEHSAAVCGGMGTVAASIDAGLIDVRSVEKLLEGCSSLQASARRFLKRSRPIEPSSPVPVVGSPIESGST